MAGLKVTVSNLLPTWPDLAKKHKLNLNHQSKETNLCRHRSTNSLAGGLQVSGRTGMGLSDPIANIAAIGCISALKTKQIEIKNGKDVWCIGPTGVKNNTGCGQMWQGDVGVNQIMRLGLSTVRSWVDMVTSRMFPVLLYPTPIYGYPVLGTGNESGSVQELSDNWCWWSASKCGYKQVHK